MSGIIQKDLSEPIWEQQASESGKAYDAFCKVRDAGPRREVLAVFREYSGREDAPSPSGTWNRWAREWRWGERVDAYDKHQASQNDRARRQAHQEEYSQKLEEYRKAHEDAGKAGFNLILIGTRVLKNFIAEYDNPRDDRGRYRTDENGKLLKPTRTIKSAGEAQSLAVVLDKYTKVSPDWWDKALGIPELRDQLEALNVAEE